MLIHYSIKEANCQMHFVTLRHNNTKMLLKQKYSRLYKIDTVSLVYFTAIFVCLFINALWPIAFVVFIVWPISLPYGYPVIIYLHPFMFAISWKKRN